MKKSLLFILLTLIFIGGYAQTKHVGIKAGVNFASLTGDGLDGLEDKTGYHIGVTGELGLNDNFSIQPEIMYSTQGAKLEDIDFDIDYINVPLLAKFYMVKNVSFMVGPQFGYVISDNFDALETDSLKDFDLSGAVGVEARILSFFVQARYNFGLSDVMDSEAKNAVFQFSVGHNFL
ncbi:hypothetical protein NBRC110019_27600 [Neptunitalea chrysea]|uniref:Outer membrane protein beta-barrel domain-containing protein n=1 Tax=Neptunitalea chrysea TaxID=1647581 RepID=A0A9W6EVE4_9FLAO|nr:porin family protein [Neptunitalea chrysea]GLB53719.1 hypothetical protein NBRC110019_27600 [Neptunitalea chrysea]